MIDKSVRIEEQPLTADDRKELRRQNTMFVGGAILMVVLLLMVEFLLVYDLWWRVGLGLPLLALVMVFGSSAWNNLRDLSYQRKVVHTGKVWDTYQQILVQSTGGGRSTARWKFFFSLGEKSYPYFDVAIEPNLEPEPDQMARANSIRVGQTVEMHFTRSGYRLKERVVREAPNTAARAASLDAKIECNYLLTQAYPPAWDLNQRGKFYFFSFGGILVPMDQARFSLFATGCEAQTESNLLAQGRLHIKAKDLQNNWVYLS